MDHETIADCRTCCSSTVVALFKVRFRIAKDPFGVGTLTAFAVNLFSKDGITFNLLLPGYTNTNRIKALNLSEEKIKEMVPAGRLGEPEEIADLASFLASPRAGYITGQSIAVDGGVLRGH